jgi:hypothetical protein
VSVHPEFSVDCAEGLLVTIRQRCLRRRIWLGINHLVLEVFLRMVSVSVSKTENGILKKKLIHAHS